MDDYGLYIYLFFLAVSLIGGLMKKRRAKQEKNRQETTPYEEALEPVVMPADSRTKYVNPSEQKRSRFAESVRQSEHTEKTTQWKSETPRHRSADIASAEILSEDTTEEEGDRHDFDLRQAVIYSEILNRPYP
ncbi:MAG: hypothetical protein Kow0075_15590 [Salibacteraceae bacterium]